MTGNSGEFKNTTDALRRRVLKLEDELFYIEKRHSEIKSEVKEIKNVLERRAGVDNANN